MSARGFTESETGLDSRMSPLALIKSAPGEYSYWGFKGLNSRQKKFPDGKTINLCLSTSLEHEERKRVQSPQQINNEIRKLQGLRKIIGTEYMRQYHAEMKMLFAKLGKVT